MTKRTPEALDELRRLTAAGHPDHESATLLGVDERTIVRWRKHASIATGWQPTTTAAHGTRSRYAAGCKCQPCLTGHAEAQRLYYASQRARTPHAPRNNQPWTTDEDQTLLDPSHGTILQRAALLGRSFEAARLRLEKLRRIARTTGAHQ